MSNTRRIVRVLRMRSSRICTMTCWLSAHIERNARGRMSACEQERGTTQVEHTTELYTNFSIHLPVDIYYISIHCIRGFAFVRISTFRGTHATQCASTQYNGPGLYGYMG